MATNNAINTTLRYYFSAYKSGGNQNVSGGSEDLVTFATVSFQSGTQYNSGTSTFTCAVAGIYFVHSQLFAATIGNDSDTSVIKKNATAVAYGSRVKGTFTANQFVCSALVELAVGDTVTITYYCGAGTATIEGSAATTNFSMFKVN